MLTFLKKYKTQLYFHLLVNLLIAIFITLASYVHTPLSGFTSYTAYIIHFLLLQFTLFGFTYLISLNKIIFKIVFPALFIVLSLFSYWVYTQDVSITKSLIQAVFETNFDIASDLITIPFISYALLSFLALIFVLKKYNKLELPSIKSPLLLLSIIAILVFYLIENKRYGTLKRRLPYNVFWGVKDYYNQEKIILNTVSSSLKSDINNLNIIFILGESLRANHLQLNGYNRKTTPLLSKQKNVISFPNLYTPLTYTAVSVPQILTNISIHDSIEKGVYSLYSVLNNIDFSTY